MGSRRGETASDDQIISAIGNFGRWQLRYFLLVCLVQLPTSFPSLSSVFTSASTDYWCAPPANASGFEDLDIEEWRNLSSPLIQRAGKWERDPCHIWDSEDYSQPDDNATQNSLFPNTIIQEYDLVCDRSIKASHAQSAFFAGLLLGVFGGGVLSDKFGRKAVLPPMVLGMSLLGALSSFMPSVEAFIAIRFFHGLSTISIFTVCFVWVMEICGGKWQTILGIGFEAPWVIGWFTLGLIAHLWPDWKHIQLITSVPAVLGVLSYWFLPESPKWLLATGKIKKAEAIVRQIATSNERPLPADWKLNPVIKPTEAGEAKQANFFHLLSSRNMAAKTLILYFNWFANSFVYYGLTLNSGDIGGTVMGNYLLGGFTEIPAYIFSLWILLKKGRRIPYATMMFCGGFSLLATILVPRGHFHLNWPIVALAMIGKLCITGTFGIAYVYSAEIYPTVVRSVGVGSSSLWARFGGMVAPYVGNTSKTIGPAFPIGVFGVTALLAGAMAILLPETMNRKLPDTMEEGERVPVGLCGSQPAEDEQELNVIANEKTAKA